MITVIGSLKGGSGKSTVTFNMAVWLSMAGSKVLAIDVDPQATLTDVAEVRREEGYDPSIEVKGKTALRQDKMEGYDEVLIDIGTADIESMKQAISLADRIVIPVPPSQADIWSTQRFIRFVASVCGKDNLPPMMGFINRADTHKAVRESDEAAAALVSLPHVTYLKPRLCQRTVFRRSFSEGLAVFELDPRSKGTREWNALVALLYPSLVS